MADLVLDYTRHALHAVAELVLAGPQYRAIGTIKLRPAPGGFRTVLDPPISVDGSDLVAGGRRWPIDGSTATALAAAVGLEPVGLGDVYPGGSGATADEPLRVDAAAARRIADAYATGDSALRRLAPDSEPILWPEHFDLGIRLDGVNYGVSPGDDYLSEPYAYVGPDDVAPDDYWNAPFGRAWPIRELDGVQGTYAFFADGRAHAV